MEKITSITFRRTANIFVNIGIVAFRKYAKAYQDDNPDSFPTSQLEELGEDELTVHCDKLLEFLEKVYYYMGEKIYDTPNQKQYDERYNIYYIEKTDEFKRFPKMNTYGLTHLFTNNAQGLTTKKENAPKIKELRKEHPELAAKIERKYEELGVKLLAKVYLNEPYTKITRLEVDEKYLSEGKHLCPITGESFADLVEAINTSPFFSGLANFNSVLSSTSNKISWKAMYAIRFAPALCYYSYQNSYDTIICHFFNSSNLKRLSKIYTPSNDMLRTKPELRKTNYVNNFKLHNFKVVTKSNEETEIDSNNDAVWESEITFMLLYTFYKRQFEREIIKENDIHLIHLEQVTESLVTFRADKFGDTLRPNFYEEHNNVKYMLRLFFELESKNDITFQSVWYGLRLNTPKAQSMRAKGKDFIQKAKAIERQIRASVLEKVLKGKTIIHDIEKLFFNSFKYLMDSDAKPGYRNYDNLTKFLIIYEKSINFKKMDINLQKDAVKLGRNIGGSILNFNEPKTSKEKLANVKNGRKYIIRLHRARTQKDFTDVLIGILTKYELNNSFTQDINVDNFVMVRQYVVIGALNVINGFLSLNKSKKE